MTEQEIKIWIEDEAKKYPFQMTSMAWKSGASAMYNLLSPQLELWKKAYGERNKEYLEQQKEIERLKAESQSDDEEWVKLYSNRDYWKQRCQAAEFLLGHVEPNINKRFVGYKEWQQLKSNEVQNDERSVATEDDSSTDDDKQKN